MGSSSSKSVHHETAKTPPVAGHRRSYSTNVFQSSCIRPASGSLDSSDIDDDDDGDQVSDNQVKENGKSISKSKRKINRNKKLKDKRPEEGQFDESGESSSSLSDTISSSSRNPSNRFLSRFRLFPGNISSRLRPSSSHSSRAYPESSRSSTISNDEEFPSRSFNNWNKFPQGCEIFPSCFKPMDEDLDSDNSETSSMQELARDTNHNRVEYDGNPYSSRNEAREQVEQNVRFSRNLSVGRLRDRVLQRPTFPELLSFPFQPEREATDVSEARGPRSNATNENTIISTTSSSLYVRQDLGVEITHAREARYRDLLEHRANSLERRRRIRSQVRALQRMGNRFENLSGGHERSCILSGQHRTGRCPCRLNNRDTNDASSARASISRLVLLAEALFEVLDEIHQQSGVLSSRPSLSSIGSVPAPDVVVEALPVKLYSKSPHHSNEEDEKCYICLVEYEDEDEVRVLPCHHEFHRSCIDKWLKEIHRICPLCRGDVCKSDSFPAEN